MSRPTKSADLLDTLNSAAQALMDSISFTDSLFVSSTDDGVAFPMSQIACIPQLDLAVL